MIILAGVANATGTLTSASFFVSGSASILLPSAYGGESLVMGGATGHIQVRLPDGSWVDYADGVDGELITEAGVKVLDSPGLEHRVSFTDASGTTDIPVLLVHGDVAKGGSESAWTAA